MAFNPRSDDAPTVEEIINLTSWQLRHMEKTWLVLKKTPEWKSGCDALGGVYGIAMDDDDLLLDVEDAARERLKDNYLLSIVRWAYLASTYPQALVRKQREALLKPWQARYETAV